MRAFYVYSALCCLALCIHGKVYVTDCGKCHTNGECQTESSTSNLYCQCKNGFTGNGTYCEYMTCENSNTCNKNANCTTIAPGNLNCNCKSGFSGNGFYCLDVDECATSTHDCHQHATCSNNEGSYSCSCNTAYTGNGSYCEATTCKNANPCSINSDCSDSGTYLSCTCKSGFTGGLACSDVNECASSTTNDCHQHASCSNTEGSYSCSCNTAYIGNGSYCEATTCENSNPCSINSDCSNSGSYLSCTCKSGFTGGLACSDIDECATNTHTCHQFATCTNTGGSYTCSCNAAYNGNGTYCEDIDECSSSDLNKCHQQATCDNTEGSYSCICNSMYIGNGTHCEAQTCENANPCNVNAYCSVAPNAFLCACKEGFTGGLSCVDVDECASPTTHNCHQHATCSNTEGSYSCSCNTQYIGNGTYCEATTCENASPCSIHADCSNRGTYLSCRCKSGFTGGLACADIDECSTELHSCHVNAVCTNTVGSYSCKCKPTYVGNGSSCTECPVCLEHSSCLSISENSTTCACDNGFKGKSGACTGYCNEANFIVGNATFTFTETWFGEIRFSDEKCSSGRAKASITCSSVSGSFVFNESSYHAVPCDDTLKSVAKQVNWEVAENEELEEGVSKLNVLVSAGENLSEEDRKIFLDAVDVSSKSLINKTDAVTLQTLKEVVVAANSVTESLNVAVKKDSKRNVTLVEQGQILVNALQIFAGKVSLSTPDVIVETENIRAEVKTQLSADEPFYRYTSKSIEIFVPQEALQQAKSIEENDQSSKRLTRSLSPDQNSTDVENYGRIVFIEYKGSTLFQTSEDVEQVVTVKLGGVNQQITNLKTPLEFVSKSINSSALQTKPIDGKLQKEKSFPKCSFYDPKTHTFLTEGCCLVRNRSTPTCKCDHLTSFAVLLAHDVVDDDVALSVVTTVGCIISSVGLVIVIGLNISEKNVGGRTSRQRTLTVFAHICITLLGVYITFLVGVPRTENGNVCTAISALLHYLLLATWCWTTVYSYAMYRTLSALANEFDEHFVKKSSAVAYGVPLVAVLITLFSNLQTGVVEPSQEQSDIKYCDESANLLSNTDDLHENAQSSDLFHGYRAKNMCWITGNSLKFGFLLPAGLMLLINYVFFVFVIYSLAGRRQKMRNHTSRRSSTREITVAASIATTLGLTWLFGYLMLISTDKNYHTTMAWFFTVTNVVQGFILFIFAMLRRAELGEKLVDSVKTSVNSISENFSSRMKHIKQGKKYVVNKNNKDDASTSSTTESTAHIYRYDRSTMETQDTVVSESKS